MYDARNFDVTFKENAEKTAKTAKIAEKCEEIKGKPEEIRENVEERDDDADFEDESADFRRISKEKDEEFAEKRAQDEDFSYLHDKDKLKVSEFANFA